jgi:hypothetical protein
MHFKKEIELLWQARALQFWVVDLPTRNNTGERGGKQMLSICNNMITKIWADLNILAERLQSQLNPFLSKEFQIPL